jgi:hypothetical protein
MDERERATGLGGGAVIALWIVGAFAFVGAVASAVTINFIGVGICLIAAAIAFGAIAHVIFGGK